MRDPQARDLKTTQAVFTDRLLGAMAAGIVLAGAWSAAANGADLNALVSEVAGHFDLPGAVLLVSGPNGTETATTGFADLISRTPVSEQTRFHVASVGKMLTAVAVLQLVDEKKLSLDDPVLPFLDRRDAQRITHANTATIRQLLSHTSGLPDCLRNASFSTPEHPSITWTAAEALRQGKCLGPTAPGIYSYSNTNYIMLGYILEKIEKDSLPGILTRRVLKPLEMTTSTASVDVTAPAGLAHGYRPATPQGERKDASLLAWSSHLGDAPLTTTAADLALLFKDLFGPSTRLLSPPMLAAMRSEWGKDEDEAYGFGLELVPTKNGIRHGHSGRFAGYCAEAWFYPEKETTVIFLGNGDEHTEDDVMELIESRLFQTSAQTSGQAQ
ncbi:MAG TPA: beta-lactamase family protein [Rhodospirillaceae bacterium]|nr:beta-lactamase family protein [Rhodospirillaceae bacterium]